MSARTCPVCSSNPLAPGRTVCKHCTGTLRGLLTDLPDKMDALTAALGRLLRFQERVGGKDAETPVPVNEEVSDVAYHARTTLLIWTDHVAQARGEQTPDTWADIAQFLDVRAQWIASQDAGPDAYNAIIDALRAVNRVIDRPRYRRIPVHVPCVQYDTSDLGERVPCPGSYYVTLDNTQSFTAVPDMICDHDPTHRLTPAEWQRGARRGAYSSIAVRGFLATLRATG